MIDIDFKRLRLLIVDDKAHTLRLLRTVLRGFGVSSINEAEDGAKALESFALHLPDIVITDLVMPNLDGLKLIRAIRQPGASANPYVPIIVVSGHSENKRVVAARDAGANEFLAKPISAKELYDRIVSVVANSRPFIKTNTYFGPDRHRKVRPNYIGPERRRSSKAGKAETGPRHQRAAVMIAHDDHQFIVPKNKLRKAVITKQYVLPGEVHPVKKAERELAVEFWPWMNSEFDNSTKSAAISLLAVSRSRLRMPCSFLPTTSETTLRLWGFPCWRQPPTACASLSKTRLT